MRKANRAYIKIHKVRRYSKFSFGEALRSATSDAAAQCFTTATLKSRLFSHLKSIRREQLEYKKKNGDRSKRQPRRYFSFHVNGADQSAFSLSRLIISTKDEYGRSVKAKMVGLLQHGVVDRQNLFTMSKEMKTTANHVIRTILSLLSDRANRQKLFPTFYTQVSSCSCKNKNRFMFAYLENFVPWSVSEDIVASLLPVDHTHVYIDRALSATSNFIANWRYCHTERTKFCFTQSVQ